MIFIKRTESDPWFNIAAEEFLLKNRTEDIAMLWQCEPAVIIGKHQNAMAEVNPEWIRKKDIPVIRRITGGGTVYHDAGNINYTVIRTVEQREKMIDFRQFTHPVIEFLLEQGIRASFEGKNNLVVAGKKISGNSAHVHKHRVIHHGTLLFDSQLDELNASIQPTKLEIRDKAVQSIRSTVTNIRQHLRKDMDIDTFKVLLEKFIVKYYHINEIEYLSEEEVMAISQLADEKYRQPEWTYGYSQAHTFVLPVTAAGQGLEFRVSVVRGVISNIDTEATGDDASSWLSILENLKGQPHQPRHLDMYLRKLERQFPALKQLNMDLF